MRVTQFLCAASAATMAQANGFTHTCTAQLRCAGAMCDQRSGTFQIDWADDTQSLVARISSANVVMNLTHDVPGQDGAPPLYRYSEGRDIRPNTALLSELREDLLRIDMAVPTGEATITVIAMCRPLEDVQ